MSNYCCKYIIHIKGFPKLLVDRGRYVLVFGVFQSSHLLLETLGLNLQIYLRYQKHFLNFFTAKLFTISSIDTAWS